LKFFFRTTLEIDSSDDYGPTTHWRWHKYHPSIDGRGHVEPSSEINTADLFDRFKMFKDSSESNTAKSDTVEEL
jgi:hypothetical protein